MKKLLSVLSIVAPCLSAHAGQAIPLSTLEEVEGALNHGAAVSVTVDLTQCSPAGTTTAPGTTRGGLRISAYRITQDGTLSFADQHATVDASGQPIWQFIRYQVKPDQTVAFSTDLFSLPSYARLAPRISYTCTVNQGIAFFAEHR
ncbi:VirK family protein [Burkholderia metallica]|uniref:VirK family protein n=1 Tax=Burkholderia metallica TaxID=488729 RepID=UPI001F5B4EAB|nr:VirK family protein [Burkholderia metallica]